MLAQTRRPRPPGSRRSSAANAQPRAAAAEAPSLPQKRQTSLNRDRPQQPFTCLTLPETEDNSSTQPCSAPSDSSFPSPPPPYRGLPPAFIIPPPPEVYESGPSSVRSSTQVNEVEAAEWVDEETSQETLTLSGLRQLIAEQEEVGDSCLDPLIAALGRLESASLRHSRSPAPAMPGMIDLGSSQSSPSVTRPSTIRALTEPQRHQPRTRLASGGELRQSLARAEAQASEDERRIAALEAALTEARESEDSQRKAAARLRRDLSAVKRQLQYAEDLAAEQKTLPQAARFRVASRNSTPLLARKLQRRQKRMSADERLGWGAMSFPEFPGGHQESDTSILSQDEVSQVLGETTDVLSETESANATSLDLEVLESDQALPEASQATLRGTPTQAPKGKPAQEVELKIISGEEASASSLDASDVQTFAKMAATPNKFVTERSRIRPTLQSSTFLTPAKSCTRRPLTPIRQLPGTSDLSSPVGSTSSNKSANWASKPFARKHSPVKRSSGRRRVHEHHRSSSCASTNSIGGERFPTGGRTRASPSHSRDDSIRSILSDLLDFTGQRTLAAELGSHFGATPSKHDRPRLPDAFRRGLLQSDACSPRRSSLRSGTGGSPCASAASEPEKSKDTVVHGLASPLFTPAGSADSVLNPAKFVLAGKLASPENTDPYDTFSDGSVRRMRLRWSKTFSEVQEDPDRPSSRVESVDLTSGSGPLMAPWEADGTNETRPVVPTFEFNAPTPNEAVASDSDLAAPAEPVTQDPWDEYSDRATPSPRGRALKPLILCTRPEHARRSSLAMKRLSAAANGNSIALRATASRTVLKTSMEEEEPTTIPGRLVHDFFCWVLIILDYLEWALILLYRLYVDIRAGPDGLRGKPRPRAKRYYL